MLVVGNLVHLVVYQLTVLCTVTDASKYNKMVIEFRMNSFRI